MSKKMLKRSLALGALMAFVITGSAMAAENFMLIPNNENHHESNQVYDDIIGPGTFHVGKIHDNSDVVVEANSVSNANNLGMYPGSKLKVTNDAEIVNRISNNSASIEVGGKLTVGYLSCSGDNVSIVAKNLDMTNGGYVGSVVGKFEVTETLNVNGTLHYGGGDDGVDQLTNINVGKLIVNGTDSRVSMYDKVEVAEFDEVEINDSAMLQCASNDEVKINKLIVNEGKLTTRNEGYTGGTTVVNVGAVEIKENGNLIMYNSAGSGSSIDFGEVVMKTGAELVNGQYVESGKAHYGGFDNLKIDKIDTSDGIGASIYNEGKITIEETVGNELTIESSDLDGVKTEIETNNVKKLTVTSSEQQENSDNLQDTVQAIADTVQVNNGNKQVNVVANVKELGNVTATTDSNGNAVVSDVFLNDYNQGVGEMGSIGLMAWRSEMNDMNKRMGELRSANGEHGVWVRMVRGESEYGSQNIKNQYNQYKLGYDEKLSTDKSWTVGMALTYTDAESVMAGGKGENTGKGFAIYGSKLNEDGTFIDLIAKYARLDNEFEMASGAGKGDYGTNGYSFSAEYGKRIQQGNGLWIEPQVELTYGTVASVDYITSENVAVNQGSMDSLVGRVGFSLGKDIKQGNVYARASYLYDFDGETDVTYTYKGVSKALDQDLGGGWWEVGVGANINLSKATYIYADVEKTFGGEVDTNWQWNLGVRYSF